MATARDGPESGRSADTDDNLPSATNSGIEHDTISTERRPTWLAACGSLPPGAGNDFYARVGRIARKSGVAFVADCDGEALRLAAAAGCDLLVPNLHEAARLLERPLNNARDAALAAPALLDFGPRLAVITLGPAGAIAADHEDIWHAIVPPATGGCAVGAGDSFLAALLIQLQHGASTPVALRAAAAAGTAVLRSRDASMIHRADAEAIAESIEMRPIRRP